MFDYIIIGSGPAGMDLAYTLKGKGASVAVVESFLWGGLCPNFGCDPTKLMMASVETKKRVENLTGGGLVGEVKVDWAGLIARKKSTTDPFAEGAVAGFKGAGIETIHGEAAFNADGKVEVDGKVYEAKKYIIATGTRARHLPIEGGDLLKTSNDFLLLEKLPKDIVFLGTGPVTLELAQIAHAAGSHVTVLAVGELTVLHFDAEQATAFLGQLAAEGIEFKDHVSIEKVLQTADGKYQLFGANGFEITTDYAVAGVGRLANTEALHLENVGVKADAHGVLVNEFLQTSNPAIYAMGDVLSKRIAHLTPVSFFEAGYLGRTIDAEKPAPIHYPVVPSVIYGATKFAEVGQLSGEGVAVKTLDMTSWYTYKRIADPLSKAKIAVNEAGEIVGASIVSTVAEEMVNLLMLLIETKVSASRIHELITAYPTVASDLGYLY